MPRPRIKNKDLPERVYKKKDVFYFVTLDNKWIRLGNTKKQMFSKLAELESGDEGKTLNQIFNRYLKEVLPKKAIATQKAQFQHTERLRKAFGKMLPTQVKKKHIAQYLDTRSAPVLANREISLLAHVYKKSIRWGYCEYNPTVGVERNKEQPRARYIEDWELEAVANAASSLETGILMSLAYLTGQRRADLLKLKKSDLQDEGIYFQQNKTGKKLIVKWTPALRECIEYARSIYDVTSIFVIHGRNGQQIKSAAMDSRWRRLMRKCMDQGIIQDRFQFRDIRAKARTDGEDKRLLGHTDPDKMARVYQRRPEVVLPVK